MFFMEGFPLGSLETNLKTGSQQKEKPVSGGDPFPRETPRFRELSGLPVPPSNLHHALLGHLERDRNRPRIYGGGKNLFFESWIPRVNALGVNGVSWIPTVDALAVNKQIMYLYTYNHFPFVILGCAHLLLLGKGKWHDSVYVDRGIVSRPLFTHIPMLLISMTSLLF